MQVILNYFGAGSFSVKKFKVFFADRKVVFLDRFYYFSVFKLVLPINYHPALLLRFLDRTERFRMKGKMSFVFSR